MKKYAIVSHRPVSNSAGLTALSLLPQHLNQAGCEARLIIPDYPDTIPPRPEEIVVYPDCIKGNHYGTKHVVRYLLMYAGYFGESTDSDFPESEYMYYYSPEFCLNDRNPNNILSVPMIKEKRFPYKPQEERQGEAVLCIKYQNLSKHGMPKDIPEEAILINKTLDLEKLFGRIKVLHCYDYSLISIEAMLCGIQVVNHYNPIYPQNFVFGDYWDYSRPRESYEKMKDIYFNIQLPDFIRKTQERFA